MDKKDIHKKNKRISWGTGIAVAVILFISSTLGMVGYIVSLDYQMVSPNYYERAENYQQHIDRVKHSKALHKPVKIKLSNDKQRIGIYFPSSFTHNDINGKVELYRPGNASLDQEIDLLPDRENAQKIATANLSRGKWLVKITWTSGGKNYYQEKRIFL